MLECAQTGKLDVYVGASGEAPQTGSPELHIFRRKILQHAGMGEYKFHCGKILGNLSGIRHLRGEDLKLERQFAISYLSETTLPLRRLHQIGPRRKAVLRIEVPMQLLPDPTHIAEAHLLVEHSRAVILLEVSVSDNCMRKAAVVRNRLDPRNFI